MSKTIGNETIAQLIRDYHGNSHCLLELLLFWGKHARTRFSHLAVMHAVEGSHKDIEKALSYLMDKGVVRKDNLKEDACYSLTGDNDLRSQVLQLARLYFHTWQLAVR